MSFCTPLTANVDAWFPVLRFGMIATSLLISLVFLITKWLDRESWKGGWNILVSCGLLFVGAVLWDYIVAVYTLIPPAFWVGLVTATVLFKIEELIRAGRFWAALKQLPAMGVERMGYWLSGLVIVGVPGLILHFLICR